MIVIDLFEIIYHSPVTVLQKHYEAIFKAGMWYRHLCSSFVTVKENGKLDKGFKGHSLGCVLHRVQTGSWPHPTLLSIGYGGSFLGGKAAGASS